MNIPRITDLYSEINKITAIRWLINAIKGIAPADDGNPGQILSLDSEGNPSWITPSAGTVPDAELSESSTNAVQNKVITKELNDNCAKKDGFYESMGVGTAVNLAGQVERTNDSMYRTSGGTEDIATGTARIEHIKGQTVAWNQLLHIEGDKTTQCYGVSINWDADNQTITFNGTATGTGYHQGDFIYGRFKINIIENHSYYFRQYYKEDVILKFNTQQAFGDFPIDADKKEGIVAKSKISYNNFSFVASVVENNVYNNVVVRYSLFDLTLIYGAGKEPTTPEQFEADYQRWFGKSLTYEPYDAGSLRNVQLSGLKTVGFNQYNPTTGTANVIGGNQYQITGTYTSLSLNGETITPDSNGKFTPTIGGTLTVNGGSTDTCVHLVWSGTKDGTYEHYEEHEVSIPVTTLKGKLNGEGESVVIFPDGMKGVGDIKDEIYYIGGKTYAVKRIGRVDLGSLTWIITSGGVFDGRNVNSTQTYFNIPNFICSKYNTTSGYSVSLSSANDKCIGGQFNQRVIICDSSYSDVETFKAAMQGVMLDYELATPLVYEVDDFTLPIRYTVNDWGTEEQLQVAGANGVAAILGVLYGVNAVDILRNLPKNYITKESMDNFLIALGSAMNGTWSKTWNETTEEYDFSFVANSQPDNSLQSINEGE